MFQLIYLNLKYIFPLQDASISYTNGHNKPSSVEITLAGRARSREDLCPDPRPKSRFEHAV